MVENDEDGGTLLQMNGYWMQNENFIKINSDRRNIHTAFFPSRKAPSHEE